MIGAVLGGGCGEREPPRSGFSFEVAAEPAPLVVLKHDTSRTPQGYRMAQLDVLLPVGTSEAVARASLQHVIDSVARADTLAAVVRVVGYVVGDVDPQSLSAPAEPAMSATWGPIDSTGFTGARRSARFRTNYLLLRPLDPPDTAGRGR
jgi:hypothetical protein